MIAAALTVSYTAFVAFYHARDRRADPDLSLRVGLARLPLLRGLGALLLALGLLLCVALLGPGRGIPVWLGLLSVAAATSLICAALRPGWHLRSVLVLAAAAVLVELARHWL